MGSTEVYLTLFIHLFTYLFIYLFQQVICVLKLKFKKSCYPFENVFLFPLPIQYNVENQAKLH